MRLVKKIIVICIILLILSAGAAGLPSQAAFTQPEPVVGGIGQFHMAAVPSIGSDGCYIHEEEAAEIFKSARERKKVTLPVPVEGITDSTGNYKYIILDDGTAQTVKHLKKGEGKITVPSVLDGYTVTSIGKKTYYKESSITSVEIPGTVTDIGEQAFCMTGIMELNIPGSVSSIGAYAFSDCNNPYFTELTIPDQVMFLGEGAFVRCGNLEKVVIGKGVEEIPDGAFASCSKLSEVVINGSPKSIGDGAFASCYELPEICIPDSVVEIEEDAFEDCHRLKSITLPKSVVKIGDGAFGFHEDGPYSDVSITGYRDTAACQYAKEYYIVFRDIETGETIHYDLLPMPWEKIKKLAAGKKKIRLKYKEVEEAFYQIAVKKSGASSWKKYRRLKPSAVIKKLESGKRYQVKVRAVRELGGEDFFGEWSMVRKVRVR